MAPVPLLIPGRWRGEKGGGDSTYDSMIVLDLKKGSVLVRPDSDKLPLAGGKD
jgi:hypothetical protein